MAIIGIVAAGAQAAMPEIWGLLIARFLSLAFFPPLLRLLLRHLLLLTPRLLLGFSVGLATVLCPSTAAELCPPESRGALGTAFQLFITIGIGSHSFSLSCSCLFHSFFSSVCSLGSSWPLKFKYSVCI